MNSVLHYINTVWSLVAIYWIVGMVLAKRTIKSESILSRATHIALGCAAVALVWEPAMGKGFLGHRLIPPADWVAWLGLALTIGGCAFAIWARTGTALAVGEIRAFIGLGLAFVGFLLKSATEEKFMRAEFSAEYARYGRRVRRLIPFVF